MAYRDEANRERMNEHHLMRVVDLSEYVGRVNLNGEIDEKVVLKTYYLNRYTGYRLTLNDEVIFEGDDMRPGMNDVHDSDDAVASVLNLLMYVTEDEELTYEQEEFVDLYAEEIQYFAMDLREGRIELGDETWR